MVVSDFSEVFGKGDVLNAVLNVEKKPSIAKSFEVIASTAPVFLKEVNRWIS